MRQVLALMIALAPAFAAFAQSSDPAYVDSPQSKAVPDPARTDRTSGSAVASREQQQYAEQEEIARQNAQIIAETERNIEAQIERLNAAQGTTMQQAEAGQFGPGATAAPIGGRSLLRDMRGRADRMAQASLPAPEQPQPSAGQQIGSALVQDGAGLLDATIQRKIEGDGGRIYLPGSVPAGTEQGEPTH